MAARAHGCLGGGETHRSAPPRPGVREHDGQSALQRPLRLAPRRTVVGAVRPRPVCSVASPTMSAATVGCRSTGLRVAAVGRRRAPRFWRCLRWTARFEFRFGHEAPVQQGRSMMRDIAIATLSGNLTREVEFRELPSGSVVARLRVASTTAGETVRRGSTRRTISPWRSSGRGRERAASTSGRFRGWWSRLSSTRREWTDEQNHRREAVTFRAREVLFEGGDASSRVGREGGAHERSSPLDGEPVGAATAGDGSAGAGDLRRPCRPDRAV